LLRYLGGSWQVVTALDPSVSRFGTADLLVDGQGIVWVSSAISYVDGGSIARWDGSAWTAYTEEQGLAGNATSDLALGPDGQVWAAHPVRGLSRFDGQNWQIEAGDPEALGLGADGFYSITFAPDGSQWFTLMSHCGFEGTCFAGLAHRAGDQWTAIHAAPGSLPTEAVIDLALNDAGQVWLGTFLGVVEVGE